ncbi:RNA polymerase sigma factor [Fulvivirga lutimaris]|uniref:RNA polymerase sigma factor n=1 Tax=Fulvivirga lutimaris TaxID=1819566 RepID=UPI0012BCE3EA|nr:RNA polymerase sigma factor [Fulvivirga lutimaris]MTI41410.1 RNA polymerase sigma factor [Fulvivirga lutimaris]
MESIGDNALMLKVKTGELDHLGLLYERYKRPLFGYFYHMNNDKMLAEDLVQAVFMRVIKYKHSFRGDGKFKTWVFHIARNVNTDHHKKHKNYTDDIEDEHNELPEMETGIHAKEEQLTQMERALTMLDKDKRELLTLSKLKSMKYREIGELYDSTESAIKVKVFRAMQALKKQYEALEMTE